MEINYDAQGLVPVVIQDWRSGEVLTLAYTWRFWGGIFLGETRAPSVAVRPVPCLLVAPVVALGAVGLVGGMFYGSLRDVRRGRPMIGRSAYRFSIASCSSSRNCIG